MPFLTEKDQIVQNRANFNNGLKGHALNLLPVIAGGILYGLAHQQMFVRHMDPGVYRSNRLLFSAFLTPLLFLGLWYLIARIQLACGIAADRAGSQRRASRFFWAFLTAPVFLLPQVSAHYACLPLAVFAAWVLIANARGLADWLKTLDRATLIHGAIVSALIAAAVLIFMCELRKNTFTFHNGIGNYGMFGRNILKLKLSTSKLLFVYAQGEEPVTDPEFYYGHPSFFAMLLSVFYLFLGVTEWVARLSSLTLMTGCTIVAYFLARRQSGRWAALLAIVSMLSFPMSTYFALKVNFMVSVMFFSLLAILYYLKTIETGRTKHCVLMMIFLACACYSDWPGFILGVCIYAHYLIFHARRVRDRRLLFGLPLLCAGLFALILIHILFIGDGWTYLSEALRYRISARTMEFNSQTIGNNHDDRFTNWAWVCRIINNILFFFTRPAALLGGLWLLGFAYRAIRRRITAADGVTAMVLAWVVLYLLAFRNGAWMHENWSMYAIVFFALVPPQLIAWSRGIMPHAVFRGRHLALILALAALYCGFLLREAIPNTIKVRSISYPQCEIEKAARYVKTHTKGDEYVAVNFDLHPNWEFNRILFYLDRKDVKVLSAADLNSAIAEKGIRYGVFGKPDPLVPIAPDLAETIFRKSNLSIHSGFLYDRPRQSGYVVADFKSEPNLIVNSPPADAKPVDIPLSKSYSLVAYQLKSRMVARTPVSALKRYLTALNPWYTELATHLDVTYYIKVLGKDEADKAVLSYLRSTSRPYNRMRNTSSWGNVLNLLHPAEFLPPGTIVKVVCTHLISDRMPDGAYELRIGTMPDEAVKLEILGLLTTSKPLAVAGNAQISESPVAPPDMRQPLGPREIMDNASFATVSWPGNQHWRMINTYSDLQTQWLEMHAPDPSQPGDTLIRVPLNEGEYELQTDMELNQDCQFPIVWMLATLDEKKTQTPVFSYTARPGERTHLHVPFGVQKPNNEVVLACRMVDGACNNWNANLFLKEVELKQVGKKLNPGNRNTPLIKNITPAAHSEANSTAVGTTSQTQTAAVTATPITAAPEVKKPGVLTGKDLWDRKSFATLDWPDHPEWKFIVLNFAVTPPRLELHPPDPGLHGITSMRMPLVPGEYTLNCKAELPKESHFPTLWWIFTHDTAGQDHEIYRIAIKPGETIPVNQSFKIDEANSELGFSCRMDDHATNHYFANVLLNDLTVTLTAAVQTTGTTGTTGTTATTRPATSSTMVAATPVPTATPAPVTSSTAIAANHAAASATAGKTIMGGPEILAKASFATIRWPNRPPEWAYIKVSDDGPVKVLEIHPHDPGSTETTTLRLPLPPGRYQLNGQMRFPQAAQFPVVWSMAARDAAGHERELFQTTLKPGAVFELAAPFEIGQQDRELSIQCRMANGAANNWNSDLTIRNTTLSAVPPAMSGH